MKEITMKLIEEGRKLSDGHFTLMAFTTHWKAIFKTLSGPHVRDVMKILTPYGTPDEAVLMAYVELGKGEQISRVEEMLEEAVAKIR